MSIYNTLTLSGNTDFRADPNLPRGLRNNNPGNLVKTAIKWIGKVPHSLNSDTRFEQFIDVEHGLRAMMLDIYNDFKTKGLNTLFTLMNEYAPPFENNTENYIRILGSATGLGPHDKIPYNAEVFKKIVRAIVKVENGRDLPENFFSKAWALLPETKRAQFTEPKKKKNTFITLGVLGALGLGLIAYSQKKK